MIFNNCNITSWNRITTTLYINGNVNIEANTEDFDVKFTKVVVDSEDKSTLTSDWTNGNLQNYKIGTTVFRDNEFTGCDYDLNCGKNTYVLETRNAHARMITVQEDLALGCTYLEHSCPSWLDESYYWTMSALSSYTMNVFYVNPNGFVNRNNVTNPIGVRAVIEINKYY